MKITVAKAKDILSAYAPDETILVERINLLSEELLNRLNHKSSLKRARFAVTGRYWTLPWNFSGCLGFVMDHIPYRIMNQWWEMLPDGPGTPSTVGDWEKPIDQGDGFVVFKDLADVDADGCYLKVVSSVNEDADQTILLKGPDANGDDVRTQDDQGAYIDGERVAIDSTGAWSTNLFTDLQQVVKPKTQGRVKLYASATSGDSDPILVAIYQPDETDPCWRRYSLPTHTATTEVTVEALCQVRHNWVENDDAVLPIGNMGALRDGLMALQAKDQGDTALYNQLMADAVQKLNDEHRRYHPAAQYPTLVQMNDLNPVQPMM